VTVNVRTLPPDVVVPSHHHPWAQLAYPIRGAIRICAAGTAWIVPANRAVWIPPEIDHDVTVLGAVELRTLYISSAAAPAPGCLYRGGRVSPAAPSARPSPRARATPVIT
jgi:quercetin dioxygenase-like cupin family protein